MTRDPGSSPTPTSSNANQSPTFGNSVSSQIAEEGGRGPRIFPASGGNKDLPTVSPYRPIAVEVEAVEAVAVEAHRAGSRLAVEAERIARETLEADAADRAPTTIAEMMKQRNIDPAKWYSHNPYAEEVAGENAKEPVAPDDFDAFFAAEVARETKALELAQPQPLEGGRKPPGPGRRYDELGRSVFTAEFNRKGHGKRAGTRNKIATTFFGDVYLIWEEQGEAILRRAAFHEPMKFADMVAKLMPQKIEFSDTTLKDLEDDRLGNILSAIARYNEAQPGGPGAFAKTIDARADEAGDGEQARLLPPLSKAD